MGHDKVGQVVAATIDDLSISGCQVAVWAWHLTFCIVFNQNLFHFIL